MELLQQDSKQRKCYGKTHDGINAIRPLKDGVIADFTATRLLLKKLINKVCRKYNIIKPRVVIGVPSGITEVEERAVEESVMQTGAREVFLIEEPMAAAIGANLDISEATGNLIVDIGAGTTEVAVISLGGIVTSNSIRIAGDELEEDIINYIRREKNLIIGYKTAEEVKKEIASAMPMMTEVNKKISGRDMLTGLPKSIEVNSREIQYAIHDSILQIVEVIKTTLETTPPELAADISIKGIFLSGGGALINNLDKLINIETKMPVYVATNPLECVVRGTEKTLENLGKMQKVLRKNQ